MMSEYFELSLFLVWMGQFLLASKALDSSFEEYRGD